MPLTAYHRPRYLQKALELLSNSGARVLAGGTTLVPNLPAGVEAVVDLQRLELDKIETVGEVLHAGAMVTLQALIDHPETPPLIRETAAREGPNTFRNAGTLGGVIVSADPESELLAALLALGAESSYSGSLLTKVAIPLGGRSATARVARTPKDRPIVAAVAHRTEKETRLALCGVADRPILVDPAEIDSLTPPADFRGSSEYRKEMARLLAGRVLREVEPS